MESVPHSIANVPRSVRQFNKWSSEQLQEGLSAGDFGPNANATLARHSDILATVRELVSTAKAGRTVDPAAGRDLRMARLERETAIHRTIRQIAECEMLAARNDVRKLASKVAQLEAVLKSTEENAAKLISELEARMEALKQENAELVSMARKITPLSRSK